MHAILWWGNFSGNCYLEVPEEDVGITLILILGKRVVRMELVHGCAQWRDLVLMAVLNFVCT
jgi:hypothetical protein